MQQRNALVVTSSSLVGVALVAYGLKVRAAPFSDEVLEQCLFERKGEYYDTYGTTFQLGRVIDGQLCILFTMFNNICRTLVGKALGTIFASVLFPVLAVTYLEASDRGLASVLMLMIVTLIGQIVTIGVALNALWIPYVWLTKFTPESSVKAPYGAKVDHRGVVEALWLSMFLSLTALLPTFAITASHAHWTTANSVFQTFPLMFAPVLLAVLRKSKAGSVSSSDEEGMAYSKLLTLLGAITIPIWWFGIAQLFLDFNLPAAEERKSLANHLFSPLLRQTLTLPSLRLRPTFFREFNEGAQFILSDMISVIIAMATFSRYLLFVRNTSFSQATKGRFLPNMIIGGPGYAFTSLWAQVLKVGVTDDQAAKKSK